jgi:hypothetical protein
MAPAGRWRRAGDGTLYGAAGGNPYGDGSGFVPLCSVGGSAAFSCGTLWTIDPQRRFSQLAVFGASDGARPDAAPGGRAAPPRHARAAERAWRLPLDAVPFVAAACV